MYNDKLTKSLAEAVKKCMGEELKGDQHKLDVNKNNKIDAEDLKHLRAGKKPVEEAMQKSDVPAYLRKEKGEKPLTVTDVKGPRPDSISSKQALATLRNEEQEQILEYESKNGVYRHQGTYGRAKDAEAGETDWDKEEKGEPEVKAKKPRKLGARQNFVRSKRVNEGFSSMLDTYEQDGIKGLFEAWAKKKALKEEPTNDEFKKELDKAQAKSEGKEKAEVAKAAVQAVQQEEVEQLDELSPGTLKSYVNKAKPELKSAQAERASAREVKDYKTAGAAGDTVNKRREGIKTAKAKLNAEEVELEEETHTEVQVIDFNDVNGVKESTIDLDERTLTAGETKKKEEIVKSMKKGIQGFKDRYGADAKSVMYATATKQAKKD